ncbi:hypothetical protein Trydic_g20943 [Trypoxylus dichotomus]
MTTEQVPLCIDVSLFHVEVVYKTSQHYPHVSYIISEQPSCLRPPNTFVELEKLLRNVHHPRFPPKSPSRLSSTSPFSPSYKVIRAQHRQHVAYNASHS